jgi:hypothetical protein
VTDYALDGRGLGVRGSSPRTVKNSLVHVVQTHLVAYLMGTWDYPPRAKETEREATYMHGVVLQ